jgi:hypothetical protein
MLPRDFGTVAEQLRRSTVQVRNGGSAAARATLFRGDILAGMSLDDPYEAIENRDALVLRFVRGGWRVREAAIRLAA